MSGRTTGHGSFLLWPLVRHETIVDSDDPRLAHMIPNFRQKLVHEANALSGLYGAPVFLVGSALRVGNRVPRDFDLRIPLQHFDFTLRYGGSVADWEEQMHTGDWQAVRWRWSDDCVHQSRKAMMNVHHLVDVQIQPLEYFEKSNGARVRLDTRGRFAASLQVRGR
jgi:hypothetical protein